MHPTQHFVLLSKGLEEPYPQIWLYFFIYSFALLSEFLVSWEMYACDLVLQNFSQANWIRELKEYLIECRQIF